jgi:probable F420-dependent oxidoreductase
MTSANYKAPESSEGTAGRAPAGLGRFGLWATSWTAKPELAVAAERLGYGAIWLGSADGELRLVEKMLDATSTITVATGIVNIWANPAGTVAEAWHRVEKAHPGRLLLGLGVGHREVIDAYERPYQALNGYLDELDAAGVPAGRRALAALGPQVLRHENAVLRRKIGRVRYQPTDRRRGVPAGGLGYFL